MFKLRNLLRYLGQILMTITAVVAFVDGAYAIYPIELTFNMLDTDNGLLAKNMHIPWATEVEKRTNGRIKIVFYWSGGLGNPGRNYSLVKKGVADIGWANPTYTPGRFPRTSVLNLPYLFEDAISGAKATWEMYEGELKQEYSDVHLLTLTSTGPADIITAKKPVRRLEDLKGMKIRTSGEIPMRIMRSLGAIPVQLSLIELYEALERGTVDGVLINCAGVVPFGLQEVVKYLTEVRLYSQNIYYIMNIDRWRSLSDEDRKIITEISEGRLADIGGQSFQEETRVVKEKILPRAGVEIIRLSDKDMDRWKKLVAPVNDWWIKEMESKGIPGKRLLKKAQMLSRKYK